MRVTSRPFVWAMLLLLASAAGIALFARYSPVRQRRPPSPGRAGEPGTAPPETEKVAAPKGPKVWLVAIGIDQSLDPAIPPCRGASRDARAVARWFSETAGWGSGNVLLLDGLGQEKPPEGTGHVD